MSVIAPRRMEQSIFKTIVEMANEMERMEEMEEEKQLYIRHFSRKIADGYYDVDCVTTESYQLTSSRLDCFIRFNGLKVAFERFQYWDFPSSGRIRLDVAIHIITNENTNEKRHHHYPSSDKENCLLPLNFSSRSMTYTPEDDESRDEAIYECIGELRPHLWTILSTHYEDKNGITL